MTIDQPAFRRFAIARILGMPIFALVVLLAVGAGFKPAPVAPGLMPAQAAAGATDASAAAPQGV